jgi:CheY-like chemotaxis protein
VNDPSLICSDNAQVGVFRQGLHAQELKAQTVYASEDAVEVRLVYDLTCENRLPVFGLYLHPLEGRSVSVAELASNHYAVDLPCTLLAHHQSSSECLIPRSVDPPNTLGARLCLVGAIRGTIVWLGLGPLPHERFGMEKRILLVEDDGAFREVFTHALREALAPEQLDVTFVEAGTLAEARTRLREGGLDAALIDVTMPDGDGLELVGEIHDGGAGSPIPTLVLTASLETSVAGRVMEAGARGALSKVVSMPETVEAIERLFDAPIEGQR